MPKAALLTLSLAHTEHRALKERRLRAALFLQGNQKWCCGDMPHFDLGNKAFAKLAPQVGRS